MQSTNLKEGCMPCFSTDVDQALSVGEFAGSLVLWIDFVMQVRSSVALIPLAPSPLPVRGIATIGWRGRSFSLGIADAVTVLAASASASDAAATMIANAVDLPGHRAILRVPATDLQPDSDLGTRRVTQGVGILSPYEVTAALDRGVRLAQIMIDNAAIAACALHLQGVTRNVEAQQDRRTAQHASGQGQKIHRHH